MSKYEVTERRLKDQHLGISYHAATSMGWTGWKVRDAIAPVCFQTHTDDSSTMPSIFSSPSTAKCSKFQSRTLPPRHPLASKKGCVGWNYLKRDLYKVIGFKTEILGHLLDVPRVSSKYRKTETSFLLHCSLFQFLKFWIRLCHSSLIHGWQFNSYLSWLPLMFSVTLLHNHLMFVNSISADH